MLELLERLEDRLSNTFEKVAIGDNVCFLLENGSVAHLTVFLNWGCVVVEYADSIEDAKKNIYEDGDQFYITDMTEDDMLNSILEEMEENGHG